MQDNPFARLRRESVAVYASTYAGPLTVPSWTVTGALAVGGNTTLTGALAVTGASAFTGAVTMASTLGVTGAATLSSTLAVTGATTLSAGLSGTTATFSSTFNATGAGTFGSTLAVTGATTLSAALSGTTGTFSSTLGVTGVLSANTIGVLSGTTATVYNTTATTVNFGGAANTINIGAQAAYFTNAGWNSGVLTNMLGIVGSANPGLLVDASSGSATAAKVIVNCAADTSYGKFQFRVANTKYFEWAMQGNALTSMKLFYSDSDTLCATFTSAGALTMVGAVAATGYTATTTGFTSQFLSRRSDNTAGARCGPYLMQGVNASSAYVTYAGIYGRSDTLTAGVEDGSLLAYTMRAGTLTLAATIDQNANTTLNGDLTLVGGDIIASTATTWNVLNTVATTVNAFGVSAATTIGDATTSTTTLRGGTLVGNTTTQAVFNTVATTVNVFGVASTINIATGSIGAITANIGDTATSGSRIFRMRSGASGQTANIVYADSGTDKWALYHTHSTDSLLVYSYTNSSNEFTIATTGVTVRLDLAVNGGDFTTTATTFNLLNATATTVNAFGGASVALNIGNASGPITFAGRIVTTLSSTTRAYFNLPHGAAPSAPVNGDMWTTTAGLYVHINGSTVGPLS